MSDTVYKKKFKRNVIELFKSGNATEDQWNEMADAVYVCSCGNYDEFLPCSDISESVDPEHRYINNLPLDDSEVLDH